MWFSSFNNRRVTVFIWKEKMEIVREWANKIRKNRKRVLDWEWVKSIDIIERAEGNSEDSVVFMNVGVIHMKGVGKKGRIGNIFRNYIEIFREWVCIWRWVWIGMVWDKYWRNEWEGSRDGRSFGIEYVDGKWYGVSDKDRVSGIIGL